MNSIEKNPNEPPEEYSAEHFEDPLQQAIKEPWYKKILKNKKLLLIIGGAIVIITIILLLLLGGGQGNFSGQRVYLEIDGFDSVSSGSEVTYRINAVNKEEVDLTKVEIELIFPNGFEYRSSTLEKDEVGNIWKLGRIDKNTASDFSVSGILTGTANELKITKGVMRFQPGGIGSDFSVESESSTVIATGNVTLTVDAPKTSASGNDIEYVIRYENRDSEESSGLYIRTTYPDGFFYSKAEPSPTEGNALWKLPDLSGGTKEEITIQGQLSGANNEAKKIVVELGTMDSSGNFVRQLMKEDSTRVVESAVTITQTPVGKEDDIVDPGEELEIVLKYENQGSVGLRNVSLETTFSNPDLIDFSRFNSNNGSYNDGKITWNSTGVPDLALVQPGASGEIEFAFVIKDRLEMPIDSVEDKNFSLVIQTAVLSEDIPVSVSAERKVESESLDLKVNSFVTVEVVGLYYDQFSGEPVGSGPMPPRVNQKTTYHIIWEVTDLANDLGDACVSVVLAPGASWEDNANVTHGQDLKYDSDTGEVIWDIGRVPANTGTFSETIAASFDISITPGEDKLGEVVGLLQETVFSAVDTFTKKDLKGDDKPLTTELKDDVFAKSKDKVEP